MGLPAKTMDLFRGGATVTLDLCTDAWGTPVLFVSTSASAAHQLEARLAGPGDDAFHVTHAPRWQAALEALEAQDFAAVLLDGDGLDVDPARAYALLRKVAKATPAFTVAEHPADADLAHVVPRHAIDRRGLLRRIRARSVRRPSTVGRAGAEAPPTRQTRVAAWLAQVLDALRAGHPTDDLQLDLEPLASGRGRRPEALVAQLGARAPDGGRISPDALERGLTACDGHFDAWRWLLDAVCDRLVRHEIAHVVVPLRMGLGHGQVLDALSDTLADNRIPPEQVQVALPEADVLLDPATARIWAAELGLLGVTVALTGVGEGPSPLEAIAALRPARLELAPALVARLHASADARLTASAIVAVAEALGAIPSAAGVDLDIQARLVEEHGFALQRGGWLTSY